MADHAATTTSYGPPVFWCLQPGATVAALSIFMVSAIWVTFQENEYVAAWPPEE